MTFSDWQHGENALVAVRTEARSGSESAPRSEARPEQSAGYLFRINLFALFLTAFWTPLNTLLLPKLVDPVAPAALRGTALGLLTLLGVGVAIAAQPLFGAWSDRLTTPKRRRVPITISTLAGVPFVIGLLAAPNFGVLLALYLGIQCGLNLAQAAFQAVIPDVVAEDGKAEASGFKTALEVLGNALGLAVVGALTFAGADTSSALLALVAVLFAASLVAARTIPDSDSNPQQRLGSLDLRNVFGPLASGPREFRLVVLARFLFLLGLYPVQRFVLFLLEDRYDVKDPLARAAVFILLAIAVAAAFGWLAGFVETRWPSGMLVLVSVPVGSVGLVIIAIAPTLWMLAIGGLVVAAATGAFQSLTWASLAKTLRPEQAAQYFGLANIATAGAAALAGAFGPMVDVFQAYLPGATYQVLFGTCAVITLTALLPLRRNGNPASHDSTPAT